jgi:hypothetical protein
MDQDPSDRTASLDSFCVSVFQGVYAAEDVALNCDLQSIFWKEARCVELQFDSHGRPYDQHLTQVRSRWARMSLYFLFICPYEELYLRPQLVTDRETFGMSRSYSLVATFKILGATKNSRFLPKGSGLTWKSISICRTTPLDGSGIRAARSPHGSTSQNASGMAHCAFLFRP